MHKDELILLGRIIKAHGFQGAVVIALESDFSEKIKEMESVFVEIDGIPVPFFIEQAKEAGSRSIIIKFEYYDTDKSISEFIGCSLFSESQPGLEIIESELPLNYTGYTVINSDNTILGTIKKVITFPMQVLFELESATGTGLLIPYNEEWIIEINSDTRSITLALPDGLDSINI